MNPNTMNKIIKATQHARQKHPEFTTGPEHAMCLAQEELGELATAINDKAGWDEIESEIYDTIAVLVRIAEKDYLKSEPEVALFPPEMVRAGNDNDNFKLTVSSALKEELDKFQISGHRLLFEARIGTGEK